LAFIHGYNLQLVDVTAKAVLLYAETINSRFYKKKEHIETKPTTI
jgi:hypothetical protein